LGLANALAARFSSPRLAWNIDEFSPKIRLDQPASQEQIVEALLAHRSEWLDMDSRFPKDVAEALAELKFTAETFREFAVTLFKADRADQWWSAFAGAESAKLTRKGERRFIRSNYYFFSGQQSLTGTANKIAANVSNQELYSLFASLPDAVRLRNVPCLRFDPQEVEDHALRFHSPDSDDFSTNVPLNYLALFALQLLPSLPGAKSVFSVGWGQDRKEIRWHLWGDFLTASTALSIQRTQLFRDEASGALFATRVVPAVRGQTYLRALPAVRLR
jgi:hypothetical protein